MSQKREKITIFAPMNSLTMMKTTAFDARIWVTYQMREDVMKRFGIGRHHLNDQLNAFADGMSFPQYINSIRMEVAYDLLTNRPEMTITEIAREVGFTAPNLREQFKRCYGITPIEYRASLITNNDGEE
jgi:AraC-like DNA-binding protein